MLLEGRHVVLDSEGDLCRNLRVHKLDGNVSYINLISFDA